MRSVSQKHVHKTVSGPRDKVDHNQKKLRSSELCASAMRRLRLHSFCLLMTSCEWTLHYRKIQASSRTCHGNSPSPTLQKTPSPNSPFSSSLKAETRTTPSSSKSTLATTSPVTARTPPLPSTSSRHQHCVLIRRTRCTASPCGWPSCDISCLTGALRRTPSGFGSAVIATRSLGRGTTILVGAASASRPCFPLGPRFPLSRPMLSRDAGFLASTSLGYAPFSPARPGWSG